MGDTCLRAERIMRAAAAEAEASGRPCRVHCRSILSFQFLWRAAGQTGDPTRRMVVQGRDAPAWCHGSFRSRGGVARVACAWPLAGSQPRRSKRPRHLARSQPVLGSLSGDVPGGYRGHVNASEPVAHVSVRCEIPLVGRRVRCVVVPVLVAQRHILRGVGVVGRLN